MRSLGQAAMRRIEIGRHEVRRRKRFCDAEQPAAERLRRAVRPCACLRETGSASRPARAQRTPASSGSPALSSRRRSIRIARNTRPDKIASAGRVCPSSRVRRPAASTARCAGVERAPDRGRVEMACSDSRNRGTGPVRRRRAIRARADEQACESDETGGGGAFHHARCSSCAAIARRRVRQVSAEPAAMTIDATSSA